MMHAILRVIPLCCVRSRSPFVVICYASVYDTALVLMDRSAQRWSGGTGLNAFQQSHEIQKANGRVVGEIDVRPLSSLTISRHQNRRATREGDGYLVDECDTFKSRCRALSFRGLSYTKLLMALLENAFIATDGEMLLGSIMCLSIQMVQALLTKPEQASVGADLERLTARSCHW
jgi:hypothetical protein